MKRHYLTWAFLVCLVYGFAQNPYTNAVNLQLRGVFKYITYPNPNIGFLYDRSVKMADSSFYDDNSTDTLDPMVWRQLYHEMYYAAHDTLPFQPDSVVQKNGNKFFPDTIPFAIMDYSYYYCKYAALNTSSYFIFDSINDVLYDNPLAPSSPYVVSNIFACAPTVETGNFTNVVFRIDPMLLFTDVVNAGYYTSSNYLKIDFGDGTGWQSFDPSVVTHYNANYAAAGEVVIKAALFDKRDPKKPIKSSRSRFRILKGYQAKKADEIINVGGLEVGVFNACDAAPEKVIIYLEGIDILDAIPSMGRNLDMIYDDMIHTRTIEELRNFNYQYYVVNWEKSTIDMRFNALYVLNLIEYLKKKYEDSEQQFVVIGESMGGVIGRYTLTYMETQAYQAGNFSSFFAEAGDPANALYILTHPEILTIGKKNRQDDLVQRMHNTRELITLDSPHQGANIPLAVQHAYRKAMNLFFPGYQFSTTLFSVGLESKAARQLLIYHINGKTNPLLNTSGYTSDPSHPRFYSQLKELGNYPRYCKLVALSNGAMSGDRQVNHYTGAPRVPGDRLLSFSTDLYARVLWIRIPILSGDLNLYTNPDPSGTFFSAALGTFTFKIKVKLWKIKINNTYGNIYSDNQIALSVKPHCVSAGGYYYSGLELPSSTPKQKSYNLSQKWLLNLFSYEFVNNGGGCVTFKSHVGWQGFASVNFDYSICSDGFDFGFIPLQSGLDYANGMNLPLTTNIQTTPIGTKLPLTPFDVIIGYDDHTNYDHLNYRDEYVFNLTGGWSANCSSYTYYDADAVGQCGVRRSVLCLEIGDEEMYLENMNLNRKADYQAQYDVRVNDRNPYYEYVSQPPALLTYQGMYSKQKPFQTLGSGQVDFFYNSASPTGVGFLLNPNGPLNYNAFDSPMAICTEDYALGRTAQGITATAYTGDAAACKIYPNPQSGSVLQVEGKVKMANSKLTLTLTDVTGRAILTGYLQSESDNSFSTSIDLQSLRLSGGVYLLQVRSDEERFTQRLVIY